VPGHYTTPVGYFGRLSTDFFGERLLRTLAENGVDTSLTLRVPGPTSLAFVDLFAGGSREPRYTFYAEAAVDRSLAVGELPTRLPASVQALHFGSISLVLEPGASSLEALLRRHPVVAIIGGAYPPVVDPPARVVVVNPSVEAVESAAPDFVVLNARYAERFEADRSPSGRALLRSLEAGTLGLHEAFRYRGPVPAWAVLQHERPMRDTAESLITNLDKVNPEMVIYRRQR